MRSIPQENPLTASCSLAHSAIKPGLLRRNVFVAGHKSPLQKQLLTSDFVKGDFRLWVEDYRLYTYPDVMVIAGEPIYHGTGTTTVTNQLLIVEVLSKSTKDYDRGD